MVSYNTSMKTAYDFLKQHDPRLAESLCSDIKHAANRLKIASDLKREREDEYDASIWQRLTQNKKDVLRPFGQAIRDVQIMYHNRENNILRTFDDMHNEINSRRESEIEAGNFVYYIVDLDTNIRQTQDDVPIIYATIKAAEWDCGDEFDIVISVAEYNRRYGSFMED